MAAGDTTVGFTPNCVVQDWGKYLVDATMATTILDRLMYRCTMLEFEGKSYRLKEAVVRTVIISSSCLERFEAAIGGGVYFMIGTLMNIDLMRRFVLSLIFTCGILMTLPIKAEVVGGIIFPNTLSGFELRSVIDNENSNPGLGVTLLYNIPGVKISVFVYNNSHSNIPDGIDSFLIKNEYKEAKINIKNVYPDAKLFGQEGWSWVAGIPLIQSEFEYTETRPGYRETVISHLYLTAKKGNIIKIRTTYLADVHPELARRIQFQFVEALCQLLVRQTPH